jgi:hypothetical protein
MTPYMKTPSENNSIVSLLVLHTEHCSQSRLRLNAYSHLLNASSFELQYSDIPCTTENTQRDDLIEATARLALFYVRAMLSTASLLAFIYALGLWATQRANASHSTYPQARQEANRLVFAHFMVSLWQSNPRELYLTYQ